MNYAELLAVSDKQQAKIAELEAQTKSRSDTIVEYSNKIAELEKERDEANCHAYYILDTCAVFSPKKLEAHNLEQKAKALSEYSEHLISEAEEIPIGLEHKGRGSNIYNWQTHFARELRYRANKLSNAKEALKEQVK